MHIVRRPSNGRQITLRQGQVGSTTATSVNEYRGEFNEEFTEATGIGYFLNHAPWVGIENNVIFEWGPFVMKRK